MGSEFIGSHKIFYHPDRIKAFLENRIIYPITVKFYLTNRCNLVCNYCVFADRISADELGFEQAKIILNKLKSMKVKALALTGGEPTYSRCFEEFSKYASGLFDLGLITNGVIYPYNLEYFKWIRVSLDTCNHSTYKKMKGRDKYFQVVGNIERMVKEKRDKKLKTTLGVQMVVTEDNYKEIMYMLPFVEEMGVDYFQFRPVENKEYPEPILKRIRETKQFIREFRKNKIKIIDSEYKWQEIEKGYKKSYPGCPGLDFIGAVDAKGNYFHCCFLVGKDFANCGNLLTESVEQIIKNRKELKKNIDYSKCPVACQGTMINKTIIKIKDQKHINFI